MNSAAALIECANTYGTGHQKYADLIFAEQDRIGTVAIHGEIWRAAAADAIPEHTPVRVTNVTGLTLTVRPQ